MSPQFARHGTIIDFTLTNAIDKRMGRDTNKAALFGTLHSIAELPECSALYWGFEAGDQNRLVILADWEGPATTSRRPGLPLNRLRPFIWEQPRIYEVIFPDGLNHLGGACNIRFSLYDHWNPYPTPGVPLTAADPSPSYATHSFHHALASHTWTEMQKARSRLCPLQVVDAQNEQPRPLLSWFMKEKAGLATGPLLPGSVLFNLKVERYPVPSKPPMVRPVEEEAENMGWVFVKLEKNQLASSVPSNPPTAPPPR